MNNKNSEFFTTETLSKLVVDIGIAFWVWDVENDSVFFNDNFFDLVGCERKEDAQMYEYWINLLHPDDRDFAAKELEDYKDGLIDSYSIETRLVMENGDIIWVHDSGKITKVDENGNALLISGVTQDITKRKTYEDLIQKEENKLKLAMKFAGFSVWEWDILQNKVIYDDDYIESLGYCDADWSDSINSWGTIIHPDDFDSVKQNIHKYLSQKGTSYNHKLRIRKNNGEYMWVRDVGEVAELDDSGKPSRILGGRIDIDELERAKSQLTTYQEGLEKEIQQRTKDIVRRDTILLELNQISQKLMKTPTGEDFNSIAYGYLDDFSSLQNNARLAIFRKKNDGMDEFSYLDNTPKTPYKTDITIEYIREVFKNSSVSFLSEGVYTDEQREEFYEIILKSSNEIDFNNIDFKNNFPTMHNHIKNNKSLNINAKDFTPKEYIFTHLQGVKSVLMSPIIVNNNFWGYILIDANVEDVFSQEDEKTLTLVGSVIAQAIHKNELELIANEAIEHNELMLDATPICCTLWKDGVNVGANEETARLFGLNRKEEFAEKFMLLSPEYQPCGGRSGDIVLNNFETVEQCGRMQMEWLHNDLQGNEIPCEVTLVKIDRGKDFVIAGYVRDLREFKALLKDIEETQEHLKQAHEEALLSSKAKTNFLANMSHEIRTPMNAISGMTDIILRETTDIEVGDYALNIKRASESLLSIINDVLDISKIESGKLDITEGDYKLTHLLNDVLTIATNRLESNKALMFTTNFQSDIPNKLIGDDIRIKQIMINILNNAIKFTNSGSISFDVWGDYAGGLLELKFSITDTGSGISPENIEKLFIEFERVDTKRNRTVEGTGLGLAISKRLADMMNGSIEIESELGKGTKFTVTVIQKYEDYLPLAEVKEQKSILVFESRQLYLNSFEEACLKLGLNDVTYCSLQSEFNEALQDKTFDYIFTSSMHMLKVQEMMLKQENDSKIVLLADSVDIKSRYDYTTIIMPAHTISIANVLNGKIMNTDDVKNTTNFTAPDCNILVVDDNLVNLKVAQGLMRPYKFTIDTAENGEEAVNKIKNNKYDLVFMDHMMPIMDGIDATIAVRNLEEDYFKNLPIIALTANAIIGTREMFIKEGMNDFLAKPIKISALNEILAKWLPKDKQVSDDGESVVVEDEVVRAINVTSLDSELGLQRVGGDFDTYIDILDMYYKDGLKRIPNIRDLYDKKKIMEFKIEVHALKSASASVGALDISEKAKLLEEASIKEDWTYINHHTLEFIDDFNILLENIREALKGLIKTTDSADKSDGDDDYFKDSLTQLIEALDTIDINMCDELLEKLFEFNWNEEKTEYLEKIKEYVDGYEYDEAIEIIETILN